MARIIAVVNQKGGVGKTTSTINLSACLALKGQKVLIIDIDPQGNSSSGLGIQKQRLKYSTYDVLVNNLPVTSAIIKTSLSNLFILPATIDLVGAEVELVAAIAREQILKNTLTDIQEQFDFVLIDCPPSLGLLTLNALAAAHSVIIPIQCEYFALEGLTQLMNTIELVRRNLNKNLCIEGMLLTMYDGRTRLSNQVISEVQRVYKTKVYRTVIPRSIRLGEAPSHGMPISEYAPQSSAAKAYESLATEIMNTLQ